MTPLQKRLRENAMRNRLARIMDDADASLAAALAGAQVLAADEMSEACDAWPWPGCASRARDRLPSARVCEQFDDRCAALAWAQARTLGPGPANLWLDPEAPMLEVDSRIWSDYAQALLEPARRGAVAFFGLVLKDMSSGLLLSEYVGYLPQDRRTNADEVVYDLVGW